MSRLEEWLVDGYRLSLSLKTGRRSLLPKAVQYSQNSDTRHSLQRSDVTLHAFVLAHISYCDFALRGSSRRKVRRLIFTIETVSDRNTRIVASLVRAQTVPFLLNILKWLLVAIPATWTNSWLSYVQNKLALAYRTRLTNEVMKQYLGEEGEDPKDGKIFYKLGALNLFSSV